MGSASEVKGVGNSAPQFETKSTLYLKRWKVLPNCKYGKLGIGYGTLSMFFSGFSGMSGHFAYSAFQVDWLSSRHVRNSAQCG